MAQPANTGQLVRLNCTPHRIYADRRDQTVFLQYQYANFLLMYATWKISQEPWSQEAQNNLAAIREQSVRLENYFFNTYTLRDVLRA
ncbi:Protein CBG27898 [Caenorhabditis briggsae]|uniref:Protein CBG27898 n=1 Tax=Caenorhabditis briggsae TaxID=6238 RepID=B6IEJ3_CAEBR|nr:Protein CBG27898 [Caenorhabditis briggsae]CAR98323.1 Protein CBG27898 [Caenorhabditis briggsae]